MKHELWLQGWKKKGKVVSVEFWGEYEGETFMDAYLNMVKAEFKGAALEYFSLDEPQVMGIPFHNSEESAIAAAK